MRRVWLIDFDDSFTYNIAAEFERTGSSCVVVHWKKWAAPAAALPDLIVLGPGPGHPDDYRIEETLLAWWKTDVPIGGICLGHQILARFIGLPVERSPRPAHGESFVWKVPVVWQKRFQWPRQVEVQRYNSLGVPARTLPRGWSGWEENGEWVMLQHPRALSYQFHPESVGTSCPELFFAPLCRLGL